MKTRNYNSIVRNSIVKTIDSYSNITGLPIDVCIDFYMAGYYDYDEESSIENRVRRVFINSVLFLDAYKMYVYKQKENLLDLDDIVMFELLVNSTDYNNIVSNLSEDSNFLRLCIKSVYEFNNLPGFAKVNVVKSLSEDENEWLLEKFQTHQLDLDQYSRELTLEDIINNIKNQYKSQQNSNKHVCIDSLIVSFLGFMKNLYKNDESNAYSLLVDIGKNDYLISKTKDDEENIDHIDLYENYSLDQIIEHLRYNEKFLVDTITNIIDNMVINVREIELEDKEVEKVLTKFKI